MVCAPICLAFELAPLPQQLRRDAVSCCLPGQGLAHPQHQCAGALRGALDSQLQEDALAGASCPPVGAG
eukprot:CAMPEP_0197712374 /NCGR_PEP_ID=MMETSP1338-20131121/129925_1 /TAXON_ID=43686 ORGANISM="Pelagodinium beii, Strain RCC1491" /NCGR_SAMPLE_ID=MMETSP1338 /ASSEMBLY_ACC=CAM_ASM_000754 /LENGTH=68 /DNA_ID=CAMNT_0043296309 /DNA_START=757 /DNA_END=967 /DNA_ORIENTATION=+